MILYKKDSKDKIRSLEITTKDNLVVQVSGLLDGKKVTTKSECIGKNIGKSNETTPEEQAILEAESKYKKKLDEGYFKTRDEAENEVVVLPMLAKDYKKESKKIDWEKDVYVQPKLDGMRCLAIIKNGQVTFMSRKGKEITTLDHIKEDLIGLEDQVLDGECYAHGLTFQENMKLIKKYRDGETEKVKFHNYDIISDCSFTIRNIKLQTLHDSNSFNHIVPVDTQVIDDENQLKTKQSEYIGLGYEGSIVRHGDESYKLNGRSSSLLKYKDFIDLACEIVDVKPSEKRPTQGNFTCKLKDGRTFSTGMRFSHEERENILTNKTDYIGKTAEVRFFEYTDENLPRFPVTIGLRIDK